MASAQADTTRVRADLDAELASRYSRISQAGEFGVAVDLHDLEAASRRLYMTRFYLFAAATESIDGLLDCGMASKNIIRRPCLQPTL